MKKIITIITIVAISAMFTACGKIPFEKKKPLNDAALVYVYVSPDTGINDTNRESAYQIGLDGKKIDGSIAAYEYKFYNLRPGQVTLSAYRADVEEQKIKLNLTAGNTYFLRIKSFSDDFGKFEIKRMNSNDAYSELINTTLAGEYVKSENAIAALITPEDEKAMTAPAPVVQATSKTDELEKAYSLKEKGILSDEEFNTLKAEILAK